LDDAFKILLTKLAINPDVRHIPVTLPDCNDHYVVPYDKKGKKSKTETTILDLTKGAKIVVPVPGACNEGCVGEVKGREGPHYSLVIEEPDGRYRYLLGAWWIDCALRGTITWLPVINREPKSDPQLPSEFTVVQKHYHTQEKEEQYHDWGLSLEGVDDFVQELTWKLHETFSPSSVKQTSPPFSIVRSGWGTFKVGIEMKLKPEFDPDQNTIIASHTLVFSEEGERVATTTIPIPNTEKKPNKP